MNNIIEQIKHNEKVDHPLGGEIDLRYIVESNANDIVALLSKWLTAHNGEQSDYYAGMLKQELNDLVEIQAREIIEEQEQDEK